MEKMIDKKEILYDIWNRAKEGNASYEEISEAYHILKNEGDTLLSGIDRRLIEGDLQKGLNHIKK